MKIGLKAYFELDTDPDGDNKPSPFNPATLAVILPHLDRWIRRTAPDTNPTGAGSTAADILSRMGKMGEEENAGPPSQ